jgi:hypothetical protein
LLRRTYNHEEREMTTEGARAAARTESLFREANERTAETAEIAPLEEARLVCECGDPDCTAGIHPRLAEYEEVRPGQTHFVVKPGHEDAYEIVEKALPGAAETSVELDPRSSV